MKHLASILLVTFLEVATCYRILLVFPMTGRSHYILGNALARGLAQAGHDVTMVSPFQEKNPPKGGKYTDIFLSGLVEDQPKALSSLLDLENMNPFWYIPFINTLGNDLTLRTLDHPNFLNFLKTNQTFDAVIIEQFNNDALKALGYHFKAPLIIFSTLGTNGWINPLVGNPSPPSYIPDFFLNYTDHMSFWQRMVNWLFYQLSELNRHLYFFPAQNKMMHKYFRNAPDIQELLYNTSLVLLNSHESVNQPVPYVPNMINIGGFHINRPKELPRDLKDFMDNAKHGVVYFSMGSNIVPSQISKENRKALLGAFGKLKQNVLWKWDDDTIEGKPDNVKLAKWLPQSDILAHPNTRLFITQGGLLSTTETVYHGVPILAFPIFADQKMNAARAVLQGFCLSLRFSHILEEQLSAALNELLNNPKYKDNVKKRSKLFHDRPMKPLDVAVYWTEFVIRNKGARHLRVAATDLPWYKYLLLDVMSFVILVTSSSLYLTYRLIKWVVLKIKTTQKIKLN